MSLVKDMRRAGGLTQLELAARLGVSRTRVAHLEAQGDHVRFDTAARVAAACGLTLAWGRQPVSDVTPSVSDKTHP